MDLLYTLLIIGNVANAILLTLAMRYSRETVEQAVTLRAEFHLLSGPLKEAVSALPKTRKRRTKAEIEASKGVEYLGHTAPTAQNETDPTDG